jgi:V/A-type H+-transporting ATPase subunit E
MEIQLKELIEKIKAEGVSEAEEKANHIISEANKQAFEIIEKAKKEAAVLIVKAEADKKQFENSGMEALKQAGRDLILTMRSNLTSIFDSLIKREVSSALSNDVMLELIPLIVREWSVKKIDQIEIFLSKEDKSKLENNLLNKLSSEIRKGIIIKPHPGIKSGFRIAEKNSGSFYDFTDEGIAESLAQYLNPVLAEIIIKAIPEK